MITICKSRAVIKCLSINFLDLLVPNLTMMNLRIPLRTISNDQIASRIFISMHYNPRIL